MSTLRAIWHTQFLSLRNASRYDTRTKIAAGIVLVFNISISFWSISQLRIHVQQWQALGSVTLSTNLWLLSINIWVGMGFFAIIGMMRAMGSDETLLLFTLPIPPATRFRAFYSTFFVQNLWNWLLLEVVCVGYVLVTILGSQGLLWLLLIQCGVAASVSCVLVLALLFIRYILAPRYMRTRSIALALCSVILLIPVLIVLHSVQKLQTLPTLLTLSHLNSLLALFLFIAIVLITLGPLSAPLGNLYVEAFRNFHSGGKAKNAFTLPGIRLLQKILMRRSSLITALLAKSLLNQSRNWFFWLRLVVSIVLVALFPLLHTLIIRYGFSATIQVIGYASGVAIWHVLEVAPEAISGEANRLTLYLTAPLTIPQIIRTKLMLFLLPVLIEGLFVALLLSWQVKVSLSQLGFVLIAEFCIVTASVALPVLGSVWDEDMDTTVEGRIQALLQEEAPISPKRMGLLNLSVLLFVGMLLIVWKEQTLFAVISLGGIVVVVFVGMWHFSNTELQRKFRI